MLADTVELVIGVDTHKDTYTAAVVQAVSGAVVDQVTVPATPAGYQQLLRFADRQDGRRVWAIEGSLPDRLNRSGDRQLNQAPISRRDHAQTAGRPTPCRRGMLKRPG
jgi:UDP-N-acetylmuramyl tripeptide synthase